MKPMMTRASIFSSVFILIVFACLINSCIKEESLKTAHDRDQMLLKSGPLPDCETTCLQDGGPFEQQTQSFTSQWGQLSAFPGFFKNNKYFITTAWNDADSFYISTEISGYQYSQTGGKVKILNGPTNNNYPFSTILITLNNVTTTFSMDDPSTPDVTETAVSFTKGFALPENWTKCTPMVYTVRIEGDGHPVWLGSPSNPQNITYNLYEYCECAVAMTGLTDICCDEGTTAYYYIFINGVLTVKTGDRMAKFSFTPNYDGYVVLQGNLKAVTAMSCHEGDLTWNPDSGGENYSQIFEGEVVACQTDTIYLVWTSSDMDPVITGKWTGTLYTDNTKSTILEQMIVDPMICEDTLTGYPAP
jgi:hypothetical protein